MPVPTFTITATSGPGGTISPLGPVLVSEGGSQTFSINPNSGFAISDVLVDGQSIGAVSAYTFSNVTSDATISVTFEESQVEQPILLFNYIDAVNDVIVDQITEGTTINGALYSGQGFNIQAVTNPAVSVGSVKLELSGAVNISRTEGVSPYALFGDSAGDYFEGTIPLGQYTIKATAFSGPGLGGTVLGSLEVNFQVEFITSSLKVSLNPEEYIYPNPATEYTNVRVSMPEAWKTFELYNSAGVLVRSYSMKVLNPGMEQVVTVPISGLQHGVYTLLIQGVDGDVKKLRLVVAQ